MSHLTQGQRYEISVLKKENYSLTSIGAIIGKHKSVVCRELQRNKNAPIDAYKADVAHAKYQARKTAKPVRINFTESIRTYVESRLRCRLSPEQIVGEAKLKGVKCVSIERIYQHIWSNKRQGGDLHTYLRNKGKRYRKRGSSKDKRGIITNRVDISQRPAIVETRSRFGDFEADTIVGKDHIGGLVTLNDRMTGVIKIKKIITKEALEVASKIVDLLEPVKDLMHTITSDNGKEFALHQSVAQALNVDFFFAKPHHPWERGSNENNNRLIRQYFPKGTDFSFVNDQQVQEVEDAINNRPRKRFNFLSPLQVFYNIYPNLTVAFVT